METMKYPNVSGGTNMAVSGNGTHGDEVDSIFTSSCWQQSGGTLQGNFMDTHKLMLENSINNLGSDKLLLGSPISHHDDSEITTNSLDNIVLSPDLQELKPLPLPPFFVYTTNLSINGIQGHHYNAIAQRIPEENNNSYNSYNEQNIVSSSTCNVNVDSAGDNKNNYDDAVKLSYANCANPDSVSSAKIFDECGQQNSIDSAPQIKTEFESIENIDISAIIGCAMADTTVPNNSADAEGATGSRDSWMDIDAWIDVACADQQKTMSICQESFSEFGLPTTNTNVQQVEYSGKMQQGQGNQGSSTLQTLLTHSCMPLLQNRLQNGPPIKQEVPSSTNYGTDMISTSSPPANVVSTTDIMLTVNGRYIPSYNIHGLGEDHRIQSPDMIGQNYPHTTTTTPSTTKKSRSRAHKKQQQAASSTVFQTEQSLGLLGKEKPVHRCSICNRGFLNKSNIKVHLRTHTGEKPFRCDTCAKAFRQKAHLLKHQQIHKRIGRD